MNNNFAREAISPITGFMNDILSLGNDNDVELSEIKTYVSALADTFEDGKNSQDTDCFIPLPLPPAKFSGFVITLIEDDKSSDTAMLFGLSEGYVYNWLDRVTDLKPCTVVGIDVAEAFQCKWGVFQSCGVYSPNHVYFESNGVVLLEDGKVIADKFAESDGNINYLYKYDNEHICLMPYKKEGWLKSGKCNYQNFVGDSSDYLESRCVDDIEKVITNNICS
ncbi:hypothetical protein N9934_01125 [Desulfosarcina sp.]|nr:hypothetical protein [Desulfosarcina sp.]